MYYKFLAAISIFIPQKMLDYLQ